MPLRTILVVGLLNLSILRSTTSFQSPRHFHLTSPKHINIVPPLRATDKDDIVRAYQRLGEKLLKGRTETPTNDLPPPTPIAEPPVNLNAVTAPFTSPPPLLPPLDQISEQSSQSANNVVSDTIQKAQGAYRAAAHSLTDSPRQPGMVPNFIEFVRNTFARVKGPGGDSSELDALTNAKDKLSVLQRNTLDFLGIPSDGSALFTPKGSAIVEFIHSERFAWYMAAVFFILAVTQRQAGVEATRDDMNAMVIAAERKAKQAAETANQAAQGAAQAMKMTEATKAQREAIAAEKALLEEESEKLKDDIKALRTQLSEKQNKASKAAADKAKIEELEQEKASLQAQLQQTMAEMDQMRSQLKEKQNKASRVAAATAAIESLEDEKAALQANLETAASEMKNLRAELEEYQRTLATVSADAATIQSLQEEKADLEAEMGRVAMETEALRYQLEALPEEEEIEEPAPAPVLISDKLIEEPAAPPPAAAPATEQPETTPKKGTRKKASKTSKASTKKKEVVVVVEERDDWKSLSLASLKRKSVKDLTEYLESKGVTTTDAEGKPLKKIDLVDAVLSL